MARLCSDPTDPIPWENDSSQESTKWTQLLTFMQEHFLICEANPGHFPNPRQLLIALPPCVRLLYRRISLEVFQSDPFVMTKNRLCSPKSGHGMAGLLVY